MKKGINNICKFLIFGLTIASTSIIAKEKVFSRKVNEARNDFSFLLNDYFDGYLEYKDENNFAYSETQQTKISQRRTIGTRGGKKRSLYDDVKDETSEIIAANYFVGEYFEGIVKENIPESTQEEIDEIAATESGFQLANDILVQENYEESLVSYIDDLKFRDECLKTEFALVDGLPTEKQVMANECSKERIKSVFGIMKKDGISLSTALYGEDTNNSEDYNSEEETVSPSNSRIVIPFEPEETRTVEQLAILFPAWVVSAIVLGCSTLGLAAGTISIPIYGQIAAAVFVCLTVVILLTVAPYIISFISYVIGFFVNMLESLISLIGSLFSKLTKQVESDPLGTAIDKNKESLKNNNIPEDVARGLIIDSLFKGAKKISEKEFKQERRVVVLGSSDDGWIEASQCEEYIHFAISNFNDWVSKYGYDGIWAINELFLDFCILADSLFFLASRPSKYYNKDTKQILLPFKYYAKELAHINSVGYDWYELEGCVGNDFVGVMADHY